MFSLESNQKPVMEIIFEVLFQFFAEIFLQIVFEILAHFGIEFTSKRNQFTPRPILAALGYLFLGFIAGWISLGLFPTLFISSHAFQLANLFLLPIFAGAAMSALGRWRSARGDAPLRIDTFLYGFIFAFSMSAVRFFFS